MFLLMSHENHSLAQFSNVFNVSNIVIINRKLKVTLLNVIFVAYNNPGRLS